MTSDSNSDDVSASRTTIVTAQVGDEAPTAMLLGRRRTERPLREEARATELDIIATEIECHIRSNLVPSGQTACQCGEWQGSGTAWNRRDDVSWSRHVAASTIDAVAEVLNLETTALFDLLRQARRDQGFAAGTGDVLSAISGGKVAS